MDNQDMADRLKGGFESAPLSGDQTVSVMEQLIAALPEGNAPEVDSEQNFDISLTGKPPELS